MRQYGRRSDARNLNCGAVWNSALSPIRRFWLCLFASRSRFVVHLGDFSPRATSLGFGAWRSEQSLAGHNELHHPASRWPIWPRMSFVIVFTDGRERTKSDAEFHRVVNKARNAQPHQEQPREKKRKGGARTPHEQVRKNNQPNSGSYRLLPLAWRPDHRSMYSTHRRLAAAQN